MTRTIAAPLTPGTDHVTQYHNTGCQFVYLKSREHYSEESEMIQELNMIILRITCTQRMNRTIK